MREKLQRVLNKYRNLSVPAKATVWFTGCNLCMRGISFFSAPLFTRLLSSAEYGQLSIFMSYEQVFLILATWAMPAGVYQKANLKYKDDLDLFTSSLLCLDNLLTIGFVLLIVLFWKPFYALTGISGRAMFSIFIYLLVQPAYACWLMRQRMKFEYKRAVFVTLTNSIITVVVPIFAVLLLGRTAEIKFIFTLLASFAFYVIFFLKDAKYSMLSSEFTKVKHYWKYMISFDGPSVMHSLSLLVLAQSDRIMIGNLIGKTEAAYYSVAYSVSYAINLFQNAINMSLVPWCFQMLEKKNYGSIRKTVNYLLCGFGALAFSFSLVAPEIMRTLFTEDYYESIWCIPPIVVSTYFTFLYSLYVQVEAYFEKTKYIMYVSVTCSIVNILLNFVAIYWFGYIACGYTTLISYILFSLGHYAFMKKIINIEIPGAKLFNNGIVVIISILVILSTAFVTLLYPYPVVRYGLVLIVFACVVIWRKKVIDLYYLIRRKETTE